MNVLPSTRMDKPAFLAWAYGREGRCELVGGRIVMMVGASLAHGLITRTRAAATLARFRDNPPANELEVAEALVRVSQLIVDFPEIAELELK